MTTTATIAEAIAESGLDLEIPPRRPEGGAGPETGVALDFLYLGG